MSERSHWPETNRFGPELNVRLSCAEMMVGLLAMYGRREYASYGDATVPIRRTDYVDERIEQEDGTLQALRVSSCFYSQTHEKVASAQTVDLRGGIGRYRAFVLELGSTNVNEMDDIEIDSGKYRWNSLAVVAVDTETMDWIDDANVEIFDAQTGEELGSDAIFHLHGLLTSVEEELRVRMLNEAPSLQNMVRLLGVERFSYVFRAVDYIKGAGCNVCNAEQIACTHNNGLN